MNLERVPHYLRQVSNYGVNDCTGSDYNDDISLSHISGSVYETCVAIVTNNGTCYAI